MITQANHEVPFRLASLVAVDAPEGGKGSWYRYVIMQGTNQITGLRSGAESEVAGMVQEMVERMNERRIGVKRPRVKPPQAQSSRS